MKYLVSFYFISYIDKGHMFMLDKVIFSVLSIKYFFNNNFMHAVLHHAVLIWLCYL